MVLIIGPRDKVLNEDEETVELVEVIENYNDYSDLDNEDAIIDLDDYLA